MSSVPKIHLILDDSSESCDSSLVGGKAHNLWELKNRLYDQCLVPPWFCVTTSAFQQFIKDNQLEDSLHANKSDLEASSEASREAIMGGIFSTVIKDEVMRRLAVLPFDGAFVAVRSSGTDEDSAAHSFAGQFETFLFQRGVEQVCEAIKKCWCSCFSQRVMSHRLECGLPITALKMAVVVQVMVNSAVSGVGFSRHPLKPLSTDASLVEAVYGLGEGLVSGELEGDRYEVSRSTRKVTSELADKSEEFLQCETGGLRKVDVEKGRRMCPSLTDDEAVEIAQMLLLLEEEMGRPQDVEWGIEAGQLFCLQTRPIVTLLPSCFFDMSVPGSGANLWDNSNIVESYAGVTSPLTFSFISNVYKKVYTLTLQMAGVPSSVITEYHPYLSNMLGLVRGNVFYNLMNWYRCLSCMPVGDTSKFMDTMMGVKQGLDPKIESQLGEIKLTAPKYNLWTKIKVISGMMYSIYYIDHLVDKFFVNFNRCYADALSTDFCKLSLQEQMAYVKLLYKDLVGKWEVPVYNDTYVMLFFGILKKLVAKWLVDDPSKAQSLQNDLLCGQGDVESTEPTKNLMRIAEYVDTHTDRVELKTWFLESQEEVLDMLASAEKKRRGSKETIWETGRSGLRQRKVVRFASSNESSTTISPLSKAKQNVIGAIQRFLMKYGFRCINELKLEEQTLHDDPSFILNVIRGYIRMKAYSISAMEEKERVIKETAEKVVHDSLSMHKRWMFNWVLFHARRAVKHRENMRFARTKLYGVFRDLFRAIGTNLVRLGLLNDRQDVFYLTEDELFAYVEGRSVTNDLLGLVELRRKEYDGYRKGFPPPERFITQGALGPYLLYPQLLDDLDLLKSLEVEASSDPHVLRGTPCCPGSVFGVVKVVTSIEQASGLDGEILVTARTDPGWVPLYPLCSGLVIERGSLLSHSAVVARELGLPTIVSVSGGLMKRLKTGMKVHLDAGKGQLTILEQDDNQDRDPDTNQEMASANDQDKDHNDTTL